MQKESSVVYNYCWYASKINNFCQGVLLNILQASEVKQYSCYTVAVLYLMQQLYIVSQ